MEWFLSGCSVSAPGSNGFCCVSLKLEEQHEKTPHSAWGNERKIKVAKTPSHVLV